MILHAIHKLSHAAPGCSPPAPLPSAQGLACLPFCPPGLINRQAAGGKGIFAGSCPALRLLFSTGGSALLRGILCKHQFHGLYPPLCASSIPRRGVAHHTVFLHSGKFFILLSGKFYPLASLWYNKAAILNERDGTTMTNEVLNTMKTRRSCAATWTRCRSRKH